MSVVDRLTGHGRTGGRARRWLDRFPCITPFYRFTLRLYSRPSTATKLTQANERI